MQANISTQNTVTKLYSYLLLYQLKGTFFMYTLYFCFLFLSNSLFCIFSYIFFQFMLHNRESYKKDG